MPPAVRNRTLIALAAGAPLPLAFAPFDWFWLAPLAYAVLMLVWLGATPRQAFWYGWVFGCASYLGGLHWIYVSVHVFGMAPAALAIALMLGLVVAMALYSGLVGFVAARWFGTGGAAVWLAVVPALWVLAEWWRGWFLTGFGWLSAGYSQTDNWLVGLAPVGGLLAVSAAVLVLAGALATVLAGTLRERIAAAVVALAVIAACGSLDGIEWTTPRERELSVALVQGAVPQDQKWLPAQLPRTLDLYAELTRSALGSDIIVWPEAAIPDLYENQQRYLAAIEAEARAAGSTVMLGMLRYHVETATPQNALYALGAPDAVYVKRHLVPYGEYFPVPGLVRSWLRSMNLPNIDTEPGARGQRPLAVAGERIAVTICYEDVFGAEQLSSFPEATLLVNVSNDAWFGSSIALPQHLQIARMRAAEVRRFQLRATNTGITAVIDPKGRIVASLPRFEPGVLEADVRGRTGATPYARWGNLPVIAIAVLALLIQFATTKLTMRPGT